MGDAVHKKQRDTVKRVKKIGQEVWKEKVHIRYELGKS